MSREIQGAIGVPETAKVEGSYKTVFEGPHNITFCRGKFLLIKEKRFIVYEEKWYMHLHQDKFGNVKTTPICLNEETL